MKLQREFGMAELFARQWPAEMEGKALYDYAFLAGFSAGSAPDDVIQIAAQPLATEEREDLTGRRRVAEAGYASGHFAGQVERYREAKGYMPLAAYRVLTENGFAELVISVAVCPGGYSYPLFTATLVRNTGDVRDELLVGEFWGVSTVEDLTNWIGAVATANSTALVERLPVEGVVFEAYEEEVQ